MAIAKAERLMNLALCLLGTGRPLTKRELRTSIEAYIEAGTEDAVMEAAIEAGATDVESDLEKPDQYEDAPGHTVWTAFEDLNEVAEAMSKILGDPKSTAIVWKPQTEVPVTGEAAATLMKLFDALDAEDDVQQVYSNEDISEEDMAKLAG